MEDEKKLDPANTGIESADTERIGRDEKGRFLKGNPPGPGWNAHRQEAVKLKELRESLLDGSEEAIAELRRLIRESRSESIRATACKILLQNSKIIPDTVFSASWKNILVQEGGSTSLVQVLPQFGEFIKWQTMRVLNGDAGDTHKEINEG